MGIRVTIKPEYRITPPVRFDFLALDCGFCFECELDLDIGDFLFGSMVVLGFNGLAFSYSLNYLHKLEIFLGAISNLILSLRKRF